MEVAHTKIKKKGEIEIPEQILKKLGLKAGEEVELKLEERGILVKPSKSFVDELTGKNETISVMKTSEKGLADFISEEPEIYSVKDLKVRYK